MKRSLRARLAYAAIALAAVALGAAILWLRQADPEVEAEIAAERADKYCQVSMHAVAFALARWEIEHAGEPYPGRLDALSFEEPFRERCPLDDGAGGSYTLAGGIDSPPPSYAILAHEVRPNHEYRDREGRPVRAHRVLLGRMSIEAWPTGQLERYLQQQQEARQLAAEGDLETLRAAVRGSPSSFHRAWAARGLGERGADSSEESVRALDQALKTAGLYWVEIEIAVALGRLGDPRGVEVALALLARPDRLNYFERRRLVRFVQETIPADAKAAYGAGPDLDLEPLDTRDPEAEKARKLLAWWKSRSG